MNLRKPDRLTLLKAFDCTQAKREGWCLFNDGDLQRLDEAEVFSGDLAAYGYVCARAAQGSEYHKMALACVSKEWLENLIINGA